MSNRTRIDDHASWMGKGSEYPLPKESKMKRVESAEGDGGIMDYPDTNESIVRDQRAGAAKMKSKPMKPGYRY